MRHGGGAVTCPALVTVDADGLQLYCNVTKAYLCVVAYCNTIHRAHSCAYAATLARLVCSLALAPNMKRGVSLCKPKISILTKTQLIFRQQNRQIRPFGILPHALFCCVESLPMVVERHLFDVLNRSGCEYPYQANNIRSLGNQWDLTSSDASLHRAYLQRHPSSRSITNLGRLFVDCLLKQTGTGRCLQLSNEARIG
jgi:hypothetical protein